MIRKAKSVVIPGLLALLMLMCCKSIRGEQGMGYETLEGVTIIDIKADKFFWLLRPWKDGKLATMDGWARFSELSFVGANKIKIKHVVNFPRWQVDNMFAAWPEADLWFITSARMNHIAHTPNNFTRSFMPFFSGMYNQLYPILLDAEEGVLVFDYNDIKRQSTGRHYVFYNYKEDRILRETPMGEDDQNIIQGYLSAKDILAISRETRGGPASYFIYDWRTGEKTENELTKKMGELRLTVGSARRINTEKRFFIASSGQLDHYVKVGWGEGYKDVQVTPLNVLLPKGKGNIDFLLSPDGGWAFSLLAGYEGLYGEQLYRRAFYHVDGRYPGGVSLPIIVDYTGVSVERGVFVEHPVHGMCYAVEHRSRESGKDQLYLRLYTMDSVLAEINRRLFEAANGVLER